MNHPTNLGGVDPITQAEILNLYDPDRSRDVLHNGEVATAEFFAGFTREHFTALRAEGGQGLVFLSERTQSPSLLHLRRQVLEAFPKARWHQWNPVNDDHAMEGSRLLFGVPWPLVYDFEQAEVILAAEARGYIFGAAVACKLTCLS